MSETSPLYTVPPEKVQFYHEHGWVVLENVVPPSELDRILSILRSMINGEIDTKKNRADLGGHETRVQPLTENIIQIAWPTDLCSALDENLFIQRSRAISDALYKSTPGTWQLDMNQFLVKQPHTDTDTPLHQDQSYYITLEDQRACNLWLALEDVTDDMGCLWFEESPLDSPQALRHHFGAGRGTGALMCSGEVVGSHLTCAPLKAGSITVHSHLTPHYARGNTTDAPRYGYVVQTRPATAVREARIRGFDHGRNAGNKPEDRLKMLENIEKKCGEEAK